MLAYQINRKGKAFSLFLSPPAENEQWVFDSYNRWGGIYRSHLLERLLQEHDVTVLDNFSSGKRENLAGCMGKANFRLVQADLLDPKGLDEAVAGKIWCSIWLPIPMSGWEPQTQAFI